MVCFIGWRLKFTFLTLIIYSISGMILKSFAKSTAYYVAYLAVFCLFKPILFYL